MKNVEEAVLRIVPRQEPKSMEIVKLWALFQLHYRGKKGIAAEASRRLRALLGDDAFIALFQITGFCLGKPTRADYLRWFDFEPEDYRKLCSA